MLGIAEPNSSVKLYTNPTCTSLVAGTGTADGSGDFEITVSVGDNTTTTFYATATNSFGTSPCSSTSVTYVEDSSNAAVTDVTSAKANGSYTVGEVIPVQVSFNESVVVTGTPQLTLETGATDRTVDYTGGTGSNTLTFTYTVLAGDTSADLDYAGTGSLTLNSGTIQDLATNNATLTLAAPGAAGSLGANKNIVIDTTPPTVTNVTSAHLNGSYKAGVVIPITVTFSEVVNVTGTPQLTLETGATDRTVDYTGGTGSNTLTFTYTVLAGDTSADLDYAGTGSLTLNSGTIQDLATNNATLTLAAPGAAGSLGANKNIVIDTTPPTVTNVTSAHLNGSYKAGVVIPITVTFSEVVNVTGTPQLTLETGATDRTVNYTGGTGSNTLTFTYTVLAGDTSADLDYVTTTSLAAGTIRDAALNDADRTLAAPGAAGSLGANKNLVIDTTPPTVTDVSSTQANGSYKAGVLIPVTITFSEPVTVTGTPQLTLATGSPASTAVNYTSGSGTNALTFNYTVAANNTSADLDYVNTTSLTAAGTIRDAALNDANRALAAPGAAGSLGANKNLVIDTAPPTVTSVSSTQADASYKAGALIPVTVTFNEVVNVTGTPQLTLSTGSPATTAVNYASGSGTNTLTFNYTVAAGNTSADLNYQATNSLTLNGGSIQDVATNNATLTLPATGGSNSLAGNKAIVIDTTAPTVTSVSSPIANGAYNAGTVIPVTVTFNEVVNVTGTPQLTLSTGSPATTAVNYASGSGTNTLTFNYTVAAGNTSADLNYQATNSLTLNGGSIQDVATNNATLTLPATGGSNSLAGNKAIVIDTAAPTASSLQLKNNGSVAGKMENGDQVIIGFSEDMKKSTICASWLNNGSNETIQGNNDVTVTIVDGVGATNDSLQVTVASCGTFNFGSIDLGSANYVSGGNYVFNGNGSGGRATVGWTASTNTLTITMRAGAGGTLGTVGSSNATYTPSSAIQDAAANGITGTRSTGTVANF